MAIDSDNAVVRICFAGIESEAEGQFDQAAELFSKAWDQSTGDFERAIAAHYLARHQRTTEGSLYWNQKSLHHANAVTGQRVADFYPSLYLNLGKCHEDLGNHGEAQRSYEMAQSKLGAVPDGRYREILEDGINRGLGRLTNAIPPGAGEHSR